VLEFLAIYVTKRPFGTVFRLVAPLDGIPNRRSVAARSAMAGAVRKQWIADMPANYWSI
jgi:hypothetical protein